MKGRNFNGSLGGEDDFDPAYNNFVRDEGDIGKPGPTPIRDSCYAKLIGLLTKRGFITSNQYSTEDLEDLCSNMILETCKEFTRRGIKIPINLIEQIEKLALFLCKSTFCSKPKVIEMFSRPRWGEHGILIALSCRKALMKEKRGLKPEFGIGAVVDKHLIPTKPAILEECILPYEESGINTQEDLIIEMIDRRKRIENLLKKSKVSIEPSVLLKNRRMEE